MIPTNIIEHLLSVVKPGGRRLVAQEATQILVPIFPPATTLSFSAGPIADDFAQIVAGVRLGPQIVPNAFTGYVQIWGTRQIIGTFTMATLATEFQGFVWVTQATPALVYVTNVSPINQVFEVDYVSARIANKDDYEEVLGILDHLATSAKSEELAGEAVQLLQAIAGREPQRVGGA